MSIHHLLLIGQRSKTPIASKLITRQSISLPPKKGKQNKSSQAACSEQHTDSISAVEPQSFSHSLVHSNILTTFATISG
jgi:hypothetical protein